MSKNVTKITDANFKTEVLDSTTPVLVDFSANWCGPCRAIAPIIDEVAEEYSGKVKFGKLDVDENQETAQQYKVFSIPTLLIFKDGQVVGQSVGLVPKKKIIELISRVL